MCIARSSRERPFADGRSKQQIPNSHPQSPDSRLSSTLSLSSPLPSRRLLARDANGYTPLHHATLTDNERAAQMLLAVAAPSARRTLLTALATKPAAAPPKPSSAAAASVPTAASGAVATASSASTPLLLAAGQQRGGLLKAMIDAAPALFAADEELRLHLSLFDAAKERPSEVNVRCAALRSLLIVLRTHAHTCPLTFSSSYPLTPAHSLHARLSFGPPFRLSQVALLMRHCMPLQHRLLPLMKHCAVCFAPRRQTTGPQTSSDRPTQQRPQVRPTAACPESPRATHAAFAPDICLRSAPSATRCCRWSASTPTSTSR